MIKLVKVGRVRMYRRIIYVHLFTDGVELMIKVKVGFVAFAETFFPTFEPRNVCLCQS